jgi:archaellum component FlaG (FlaF/FlaG flagellin family)
MAGIMLTIKLVLFLVLTLIVMGCVAAVMVAVLCQIIQNIGDEGHEFLRPDDVASEPRPVAL